MGIVGAETRIAERNGFPTRSRVELSRRLHAWQRWSLDADRGERHTVNYKNMEHTQNNVKRRDVLVGTLRNALENATKALMEKPDRARMEARRRHGEAEQEVRTKAQSVVSQTLDRVSAELKASGIELLSAQLRFPSPEGELRRVEDSFVQAQIGPEKKKVAALENALLKLHSAKTDSEATRIIEAVA